MLHVAFEDESILVVNKASGVLSQPGKTRDGSVVTEVRDTFPDARGPLLVHRLDMDTSGLLLLAKTRNAHRLLQQQFEHRQVHKRYTALLVRNPIGLGGLIQLPLARDWENRPRQRVDYQDGKSCVTFWRLSQDASVGPSDSSQCRVHFYPQTGRTHQLRVHAAVGLNCAIVGDRLYGTASIRLMLHADRLSFIHPDTDTRIRVALDASF